MVAITKYKKKKSKLLVTRKNNKKTIKKTSKKVIRKKVGGTRKGFNKRRVSKTGVKKTRTSKKKHVAKCTKKSRKLSSKKKRKHGKKGSKLRGKKKGGARKKRTLKKIQKGGRSIKDFTNYLERLPTIPEKGYLLDVFYYPKHEAYNYIKYYNQSFSKNTIDRNVEYEIQKIVAEKLYELVENDERMEKTERAYSDSPSPKFLSLYDREKIRNFHEGASSYSSQKKADRTAKKLEQVGFYAKRGKLTKANDKFYEDISTLLNEKKFNLVPNVEEIKKIMENIYNNLMEIKLKENPGRQITPDEILSDLKENLDREMSYFIGEEKYNERQYIIDKNIKQLRTEKTAQILERHITLIKGIITNKRKNEITQNDFIEKLDNNIDEINKAYKSLDKKSFTNLIFYNLNMSLSEKETQYIEDSIEDLYRNY